MGGGGTIERRLMCVYSIALYGMPPSPRKMLNLDHMRVLLRPSKTTTTQKKISVRPLCSNSGSSLYGGWGYGTLLGGLNC